MLSVHLKYSYINKNNLTWEVQLSMFYLLKNETKHLFIYYVKRLIRPRATSASVTSDATADTNFNFKLSFLDSNMERTSESCPLSPKRILSPFLYSTS